MNNKIAVFPGSFDPFTVGHESIVKRSLSLFDRIIISIGYNTSKQGYFRLEDRVRWIKDLFSNEEKIEVETYQGLTVDFCMQKGAGFILRGLRTSADFEYERAIAQMNRTMKPEIETVFMLTLPEYTHVASAIIRDIIIHGGDASLFLPRGMDIAKKNDVK